MRKMENSLSPMWGQYLVTGMRNGDIIYPMFDHGEDGQGNHFISVVKSDTIDGSLSVGTDNIALVTDNGTIDQYAEYACGLVGVTAKGYIVGNASDYGSATEMIEAVLALFE